jgi:hypothetical protein
MVYHIPECLSFCKTMYAFDTCRPEMLSVNIVRGLERR